MSRIEEWDNWFALTDDEVSIKAWNAAKEMFPDAAGMLDNWATMIELNRLDRVYAAKKVVLV